LGSTYFWCRPFFGDEIRVTWHVVEQPNHVKVGQADFQTDELRFHATVEDVLAREKPDVLLLSGVLHFMEDPEAFLQKLVGYKIPALIVDRTPLWDHDRHRLTIQHVPAEIYQASYPAWFLSRSRIQAIIEKDYELRFHAPDSEAWEIDDDVVPNTLWFYQRLSPPS
jgi:putative methyltransferase (TIGR04325 family)